MNEILKDLENFSVNGGITIDVAIDLINRAYVEGARSNISVVTALCKKLNVCVN